MSIMDRKRPSFLLALVPIIFLVSILGLNVLWYGDGSSSGPNQIALLLSAGVAALIGLYLNFRWAEMKEGIIKSISSTLMAIIILLLIGALAGTWVLSGIVPAMVYYGLQILNPEIFLFASCVVSSIVSLATGSSWSTIATVGVALLGIGHAMDIHEGLTAGAIISGAYFGDKMSPLSDTTNLAPAMAGTDLFTHIRHMAWTTIPSIILTLIIFLIIGFSIDHSVTNSGMDNILRAIDNKFDISPFLFIVPAVVIFMIIRKVPAIPSLLVGTLLGGVAAIIFQPNIVEEAGAKTKLEIEIPDVHRYEIAWKDIEGNPIAHDVVGKIEDENNIPPGSYIMEVNAPDNITGYALIKVPRYGEIVDFSAPIKLQKAGIPLNSTAEIRFKRQNYAVSSYMAVLNAMTVKIDLSSENAALEKLIAGKGMEGMLSTIWLIICAMAFGGVMETVGLLQRITEAIISIAKSRGGLIGATAGTCVFFNATASDQYLAIVVPGRMYANTYRKRGLKPENLSRTLEDSGTVTSVLVPWNTCGATQSSQLSVETMVYAPFCFFNIISPIITVIYGIIGFKVPRIDEDKKPGE